MKNRFSKKFTYVAKGFHSNCLNLIGDTHFLIFCIPNIEILDRKLKLVGTIESKNNIHSATLCGDAIIVCNRTEIMRIDFNNLGKVTNNFITN